MKSAELNFERERKVLVEQMERQQNESQAQIQQLKNDSEKFVMHVNFSFS